MQSGPQLIQDAATDDLVIRVIDETESGLQTPEDGLVVPYLALVLLDLEVDLLFEVPVVLREQVLGEHVCDGKDDVVGERKKRDEDGRRHAHQVLRGFIVGQQLFEGQVSDRASPLEVNGQLGQLREVLVQEARACAEKTGEGRTAKEGDRPSAKTR